MMSDAQHHDDDEMPATDELKVPSTEKAPGNEPKGGKDQTEPDHEAVGIGVVGGPLTDDEAGV